MSRELFLILAGVGAALAPTPVRADETRTFQQGAGGYSATRDLHLSIPANFSGNGHKEAEHRTDPGGFVWEWVREDTFGDGTVVQGSNGWKLGSGDNTGLLRFGDLFGSGPNQVPPGATIVSATLQLVTDNQTPPTGGAANLHRVRVDWDDTSTWDGFGPTPGIQAGVDFDPNIVLNTGKTTGTHAYDVTASVQAWSDDPASNRGWLFRSVGRQTVLQVAGSALGPITNVTVDLEATTSQRGEIVATLRKGSYTALLVNRINSTCGLNNGATSNDLNITLDDAAALDVHLALAGGELVGTFRPDGVCLAAPLCPTPGVDGLCGQSADGDWVLTFYDEWIGSGGAPVLDRFAITLSDGVSSDETYTSFPALAADLDQGGDARTTVLSSENPDSAARPKLEITFAPASGFSPAALEVWPSGATETIDVTLSPGANAAGDVTVTLASDAPGIAAPVQPTLVFVQGGPTVLPLAIAIGVPGSAILTASNDGGLSPAVLPVEVAATPLSLGPDRHAAAGSGPLSLDVSIPRGANQASPVAVTLLSADATTASFGGSATLALVFPMGGASTQTVFVDLGAFPGATTLTASDDDSAIPSSVVTIGLSVEAPLEYEMHIPPYVQLGNAPLGAATDQIVLAWQTISRRASGPNADRFTVEYRRVGEPTWIPVTPDPPFDAGSLTRRNHTARLAGLNFVDSYEYRVTHLRNEGVIDSFTAVTQTRPTVADYRFTGFGNPGLGNVAQYAGAAQLATLGTRFHFLLGDFVFSFGEYERYRARIFDPYAALTPTIPFFPTIGNHEGTTDGGVTVPNHFHLPENGPPALQPERNYSFDFGDVHFAVVNSGSDIVSLATDTEPWLRADLQATSRKWKVVVTHEPPLTLDPYGIDRQANADVRDHALKVAVEEGADLFLAGATHSMQRYLPITAVTTTDPFVEWSACDAGPGTHLFYPGTGSWFRSPGAANPIPAPNLLTRPMVLYEPALATGVFDVNADSLTASFVDPVGNIVDSVEIRKCEPPGSCTCPVCGDLVIEAPETCDDGGTASGDGCSSLCRTEWLFAWFGVAAGGSITYEFGTGESVTVVTNLGDSAADVAAASAAALNADFDIIVAGFVFESTANRVSASVPFDDVIISDPGLSETAPGVAMLSPPWAAALIALLAAAAGIPLAASRRHAAR